MPRVKNHVNVVHNDKPEVPKTVAKTGKVRHMAFDHIAERSALLTAREKFIADNETEALATTCRRVHGTPD